MLHRTRKVPLKADGQLQRQQNIDNTMMSRRHEN
jgi:hypothetical protein